MKKPKLEFYGFSGRLGTGKNFISEKIFIPMMDDVPTVVLSFADHFKVDAIVKGGLERDKVYGTKDEHTRKTLQRLGTEEGRDKYGEDVWINILDEWIEQLYQRGIRRIICADCRFKNEIKFIKNRGGKIIRIVAPKRNEQRIKQEALQNNVSEESIKNHRSETDLDDLSLSTFDAVIYNDPEDDAFTQMRDIVLKFKEENRIKNQAEKLFFIDLDNTICHCNVNYNLVKDKFLNLIKSHINDESYEEFEKYYAKHANNTRNSLLYNRESLANGMISSLKGFKFTWNKEEYEKLVEEVREIGLSVHHTEFDEIGYAVDAVKKIASKYNVVIYTLGAREDQIRKIGKLGLIDLPIEVVRSKSIITLAQLKEKYSAKEYYMIGDSMEQDIVPAIDLGFDMCYHIFDICQSKLKNYKQFPKIENVVDDILEKKLDHNVSGWRPKL